MCIVENWENIEMYKEESEKFIVIQSSPSSHYYYFGVFSHTLCVCACARTCAYL